MNKKLPTLARAAFAAALFACAPSLAHATLIPDTTQNVSYAGTSPINWYGGGTASTGDAVEGGNDFNTDRVDISTGPRTLMLSFYTQFDGDDLGAHYADVFLATDPLHPDSFNYAIALGAQLPYGGVGAGLYAITNNYMTSIDRWKNTGYIYGGKYISPNDGLAHDAPTIVTGGSALPGWTVDVSQNASGDATYPYRVDVRLTALTNNILNTVFTAANVALMWGTGDCNNDTVYVAQTNTPKLAVPEPASGALLLTAVAAFLWSRRKKPARFVS